MSTIPSTVIADPATIRPIAQDLLDPAASATHLHHHGLLATLWDRILCCVRGCVVRLFDLETEFEPAD